MFLFFSLYWLCTEVQKVNLRPLSYGSLSRLQLEARPCDLPPLFYIFKYSEISGDKLLLILAWHWGMFFFFFEILQDNFFKFWNAYSRK